MKFILMAIFILNFNSAFALNDFKKCLVKGEAIGTKRLPPADVILLVPGTGTRGTVLTLGHFGNLGDYFEQIENLFDEHKINYFTVPADRKGNASVEERVLTLRKWIVRHGRAGKKVLVLGHSLGGLVARVAARDPSIRNYVTGVVTMSAPNRGDYLIDWIGEDHPRNHLLYKVARAAGFDIQKKRYLFQMGVAYAPYYDLFIDHSKLLPPVYSVVTYQSSTQLVKSFPPFMLTDEIIKTEMQNNGEDGGDWGGLSDGLAPAYTQVWGECLGMINANHATILGKTYLPKTLTEINQAWLDLIEILKKRNLLKNSTSIEKDAPNIWAKKIKTGHYQGQGFDSYQLPMEHLIEVINNYGESCQYSHCRYYMPNVVEMRSFGDTSANKFYTWTKINNIKTGTYFSEINIERKPKSIKIISRMLEKFEAKPFVRQYGLKHDPIMDTTVATWDINETYNQQGKLEQTKAKINIDVTSDSFIINRIPKKVLDNLKETMMALLKNFYI